MGDSQAIPLIGRRIIQGVRLCMSAVYHIQPHGQRVALQRLLEEIGEMCPAGLADAQILRIEVDPKQKLWRLHVSAPEIAAEDGALVQARLVAGLPEVKRVVLLPCRAEPAGGGDGPSGGDAEGGPGAMSDSDPGDSPSPLDHDGGDRAWGEALLADVPDETSDEAYLEGLIELERERQARPPASAKAGGDGRRVLFGSAIRKGPIRMDQVQDEERSVVLQGEIFSYEVKPLRSGRRLVLFEFTDRTSSVGAKLYVDEQDAGWTDELGPGKWVLARGPIQYDRVTQELTLLPRDLMLIPPPPGRVDDAERKRVELHLHTKMSALDGAADIEAVVRQVAAWGHPAVAVTDHGVVQAFPEAFAAGKRHGVKIIYGVEGYLVEKDERKARMHHIILLAKSPVGLKNLYKLISISHMSHFYRRPRIPRQTLMEHREGIIVGSACEAGELYQAILNGADEAEIERIASFYDYLEIQPIANNAFLAEEGRVRDEDELREINRKIVKLGRKLGKPVAATGDVHFLQPEDEIFRRIIMAGHGFADLERPSPLYLRTTDEMLEEFSYLGAEEAARVVIDDPLAIAESVEEMRPFPDGFHPPRIEKAEERIEEMAWAAARKKYGDPPPPPVAERITRELASIIGNGYASLYLIAQQLIERSVEEGYMVGSRGSVGSSLVAHLCGISEVNPLPPHAVCPRCRHFEMADAAVYGCGVDLPKRPCPSCGEILHRDGFDIPFETFLGFEGEKVPDIDLNFAGAYQAKAHKHAQELLGEGSVFRGGTIGTLQERTAYGYVRKYLDSKGRQVPSAEVNRLVKGCSGVRRTTGQHPGGLMVVPAGREIYEFTPIQYPANDRGSEVVTTHFTYEAIHDHLVKLDLLGHDGPTVLHMLEALTGVGPDEIPLDDSKTMQIFSGVDALGISPQDAAGEVGTLGVPEYGTGFVRQMLAETRPKTFADLVRIMGLSHGTDVWLNNAQELIRSGTLTLEETIACRDDIMLYLIRQGLEPSDAFAITEQVRKGKGLNEGQVERMKEAGVPQWYIDSCMKISYLFPKAHAAAYAKMAYQIAYYKVHHPAAFYATYFTVRVDDCDAGMFIQGKQAMKTAIEAVAAKGNEATAKERASMTVLEVAVEAVARGVGFLPVDLYRSEADRFVVESGGLRPPLAALPGLGVSAAQAIVSQRSRPFTSVEDLRRRTSVNKSVIETLQSHGALDGLPASDQLSLF